MNFFETQYFVYVLISMQFFDKFHYGLYLGLKSILCGFQRPILKFLDSENDPRHDCEMVDYNKLSLYRVDNNLVYFLRSLL